MSDNIYAAPESIVDAPDNALATYKPEVFTLQGRLSREHYTLYIVVGTLLFLLSFIPFFIAIPNMDAGQDFPVIPALLVGLAGLVYVVMGAVFAIRRLHDLDKTGWLILVMVIPFVGMLFSLYLIFAKGDAYANRFGAMPEISSGQRKAWIVFAVLLAIGIVINLLTSIGRFTL